MMKRTFVVTAITILTALVFVSFNRNEFRITPSQLSAADQKHNTSVKIIPEQFAGVYKGFKPNYVINASKEANLSPDRNSEPGKKEINFILIETGIIWMAETDLQDSSANHYEGTYTVTKNSQEIIEISAIFVAWNKTKQNFSIRFERKSGKVTARQNGEPEFDLARY